MQIVKTSQFLRTQKFITKKHIISLKDIDKTLELFISDPNSKALHYKRMSCKKDKNRYSIRILNTQYRILLNLEDDTAYLVCVCSHDDYDRRNRGC